MLFFALLITSLSLNYIKQNRLKDTSWFSGVFANTVALTPTSYILVKTSGLGGCFYVPFIGTGDSCPGFSSSNIYVADKPGFFITNFLETLKLKKAT